MDITPNMRGRSRDYADDYAYYLGRALARPGWAPLYGLGVIVKATEIKIVTHSDKRNPQVFFFKMQNVKSKSKQRFSFLLFGFAS